MLFQFSGRQHFEMDGVYIKLKVSGLRAFYSLVNEPGKYSEAIAVVYEHTKITQEILFADFWAQY